MSEAPLLGGGGALVEIAHTGQRPASTIFAPLPQSPPSPDSWRRVDGVVAGILSRLSNAIDLEIVVDADLPGGPP